MRLDFDSPPIRDILSVKAVEMSSRASFFVRQTLKVVSDSRFRGLNLLTNISKQRCWNLLSNLRQCVYAEEFCFLKDGVTP